MEDPSMEVEKAGSSGKVSKQSSRSSKMSVEQWHMEACMEEIHSLKISDSRLADRSDYAPSLMSKGSNRSDFGSTIQQATKDLKRPLLQKYSLESNVSDKMRKQMDSADMFDKCIRETQQTKEFTDPYYMSPKEAWGPVSSTALSVASTSSTANSEISLDLRQECPSLTFSEDPPNRLMEMVVEDPQEYTLVVSQVSSEQVVALPTITITPIEQPSEPIAQQEASCKCQKSKCLMKYCDCFAKQKMCSPKCQCYPCHNNEHHKSQLEKAKTLALEKDPEAFSNKLEVIDKGNQAPPSLVSKKGCHCKKTMCYTKYCQCFYSSVKCSALCKCCECLNGGENAFKES